MKHLKIQTPKSAKPHKQWVCKESYRSGHNEPDSKSGCRFNSARGFELRQPHLKKLVK